MNSRNPVPDSSVDYSYQIGNLSRRPEQPLKESDEPPFDYRAYARSKATPRKEDEPDIYLPKFRGESGSSVPDEVVPRKNSIGGRRSRRSRRRKSRRKSKRR